MFNTLLVPTDGSDPSDKAAKAALEFARQHGSKVVGLAVAEPYPYSPLADAAYLPDPTEYDRAAQDVAHANVQKIADAAQAAGVGYEGVVSFAPDPSEEIIKACAQHGCDAIFISSHGRRGLNRLLLGSVTQRVLAQAEVPVVVIR